MKHLEAAAGMWAGVPLAGISAVLLGTGLIGTADLKDGLGCLSVVTDLLKSEIVLFPKVFEEYTFISQRTIHMLCLHLRIASARWLKEKKVFAGLCSADSRF